MRNLFWVQDSAYNTVGGKNNQFDTLHQVYQYIVAKRFIAQDLGDIYEVHEAISEGGMTIQEVVDAFENGGSPTDLSQVG